MFSAATIDKLEALNAKRTRGPWVSRKHLLHDHAKWGDLAEVHRVEQIDAVGKSPMVFAEDDEWVGDSPIFQAFGEPEAEANGEFIAAVANALPELIRLARIGLTHCPTPARVEEATERDGQ